MKKSDALGSSGWKKKHTQFKKAVRVEGREKNGMKARANRTGVRSEETKPPGCLLKIDRTPRAQHLFDFRSSAMVLRGINTSRYT